MLAVVSILLAAKSSIGDWRAAEARQMYLTLTDSALVVLDSLRAIQCVPRNPGDAVRVFPAPRPDTLKRAVP